jgi:hypothetical protein
MRSVTFAGVKIVVAAKFIAPRNAKASKYACIEILLGKELQI